MLFTKLHSYQFQYYSFKLEIMKKFKLNSPYKPLGDQPKAINSLAEGINDGVREQTLLGVTGSGKTFTMAML